MTPSDHATLLAAARASLARSRLPREQKQAVLAELERLAETVEYMLGVDIGRPAKGKFTKRGERRESA